MVGSVNRNYLEKVMNLAETAEVLAIEDIFSAHKMKLIAKGAKISRDVQEKLALHKLSKPLEASIAVQGGVDVGIVVSEARQISERLEPVARLLHVAGSGGGSCPFSVLSGAHFGSAMRTMLTIAERGGNTASAHSVMVSLVSICLAKQIGLGENEQMCAALAGLFHDIGELYIDPVYLDRKRHLLPHEWRHIVVHPRVGQLLIRQLDNFPPGVAQAVSEHHERFDGAGYPRQLSGKNISIVGQVVSVAEMVSGVLTDEDRPLERAELALKVVPGEHSGELVSAISSTLRATGASGRRNVESIPAERARDMVQRIDARIASAILETQKLLDGSELKTARAKDMLQRSMNQIIIIRRAFRSTGLYACIEANARLLEANNTEILFEAAVASKEFEWRLRDIARYLALHADEIDVRDKTALQHVIGVLDLGLEAMSAAA
ncbi:MAG: hypothetical protein H6R04_474 [Burkholderiaceae bacterium]|nr:hypothetical protein [Burkholderiaceae bacterium]